MEMNRYFITALYVMAGCVVAVPLKVQFDLAPRDGIVKVISINVEVDEQVENQSQKSVLKREAHTNFQTQLFVKIGQSKAVSSYFNTSHPIRAPEYLS